MIDATTVPFLDLARTNGRVKDEIVAGIEALIDSSSFVHGEQIEAFEAAFAAYCTTSFAVGVSSGLDGLRLALLASGIEPGDEVIVPAHTFIATFEAVTQAGGVPVVVDVTRADYNVDVAAVDAALSPRTRIVLPVHLYGQMADLRSLSPLLERRGVQIVEDACQAHGARRDGIPAGAAGSASAFSFYPAKNLGAMGDAGAVTTNDSEIAARVRELREHGQSEKYKHERLGYTARLDSIQALVLLKKLPLLEGWNQQRRRLAAAYRERLEGVGDLLLPPVADASEPVWHVYAVYTADPAALADFLAERGVRTARHYPEPPHLSAAYRFLGHQRGAFPITERLADHLLSLPLFPGMTDTQLECVVDAVRAFFLDGYSSR